MVSAGEKPVEVVPPEKSCKDAVTAPEINGSSTGGEPKSSVASRRTAVVAFLREALAQGSLAAKEIERRAVDVGLLDQRDPLGKSKVFRTARAALGIVTRQQPGRRAAGWVWSMRDPSAIAS